MDPARQDSPGCSHIPDLTDLQQKSCLFSVTNLLSRLIQEGGGGEGVSLGGGVSCCICAALTERCWWFLQDHWQEDHPLPHQVGWCWCRTIPEASTCVQAKHQEDHTRFMFMLG